MSKIQWILCAAAVIWITCAIGGLYMVWAYDNPPDVPAKPQAEGPGALRLARADALGGPSEGFARAKAHLEFAGAPRT